MPSLHTVGWAVPPHYDTATKRLEWGMRLRAESNDHDIVNYTIRLLGCRYCNFNIVVAVAEDPTGRTRPVAQWGYAPDAGMYFLAAEHGPNPPGWLDAVTVALPVRNPG